MRVLALSGSLRTGSHNSRLLRAAAAAAPSGVEVVVATELLRTIPPFDEDHEAVGTPAPVVALKEAIDAADAVLFATPEYNHSIPGQLKNALDWASRPYDATPLKGKPVAVVGASTGLFGAVWAQAELRKVLEASGARVHDAELPVGMAHDAFGPDESIDRLAADEHHETLTGVLQALADLAGEPQPA